MGAVYIYTITNTESNKLYVGSSVNPEKRWKRHLRDLKNGNHDNSHLQRAFNKDGEDVLAFKVIAKCPRGFRHNIEQAMIDLHATQLDLYNQRPAVPEPRNNRGSAGYSHTEEWKAANAERMKGNKHSEGHKWTQGQREKIMKHRQRLIELSVEATSTPCKLVSPDGVVHEFANRRDAANHIGSHPSASKISEVINGSRKSIRGWTAYKGMVLS